MEKINKRIIYEALLLHEAMLAERNAFTRNSSYAEYHSQREKNYSFLESKLNQILGFKGQTLDDFTNYISSIDITPEQKKELAQFRKDPSIIKIIGEAALSKKAELEEILGVKITNQGMAFADQRGVSYAKKGEEQLEQELNMYSTKLSQMLATKTITEEQYDSYLHNLNDIYSYYVSSSRGELLAVRDLSAHQHQQISDRADENGVSFKEQFDSESEKLTIESEELQELQNEGMNR